MVPRGLPDLVLIQPISLMRSIPFSTRRTRLRSRRFHRSMAMADASYPVLLACGIRPLDKRRQLYGHIRRPPIPHFCSAIGSSLKHSTNATTGVERKKRTIVTTTEMTTKPMTTMSMACTST